MKHSKNMKQEEQVGGINGSIKCFQISWFRRDGDKKLFKSCIHNDAGSHCKACKMCNDMNKGP